MKKLLLLPIFLIALSCSSDEMSDNNTNSVDPLIGVWYDSDNGYTLTVKSNGRMITVIDDDSLPAGCEDDLVYEWQSTWRNKNPNADFTQIIQTYLITTIDLGECSDGVEGEDDFIFSDDFNSVEIGDFEGVRQ